MPDTKNPHLLTMPNPLELLTNETKMLRQMVDNINGEMLQAAVRREAILCLIQAAETEMDRLRNHPVESTQLEFPFGGDEPE